MYRGERDRRESDWEGYLPMDCEAVYEDGVAYLSGCLAEALQQDEDAGGLRIM